jgi:hypothetical protein
MTDINEFVKIASGLRPAIYLVDGAGFCVSGKSLLGAMATVEWNELYAESDEDIYSNISQFVVGEST